MKQHTCRNLFTLIALVAFMSHFIVAQEIPDHILGNWDVFAEQDACQYPIQNSVVRSFSIIDAGHDLVIDTVNLIRTMTDESRDSSYVVISFDSDHQHLINVVPIEGSLVEGAQFLQPDSVHTDSLQFVWYQPCLACNCGGRYQMVKANSSSIDIIELHDWVLYPNPVEQLLNISNPEITSSSPFELQVLNSKGNLVHIFNMKSIFYELDMSVYPSGVYFILIQDADRILWKKIVKL